MGIHLTSDTSVALVDDTTEWAFGTTFDSKDHACDFLRWLNEKPREETLPLFPPSTFGDPRTYDNNVLEKLIAQWKDERTDVDGYLLDVPAE